MPRQSHIYKITERLQDGNKGEEREFKDAKEASEYYKISPNIIKNMALKKELRNTSRFFSVKKFKYVNIPTLMEIV